MTREELEKEIDDKLNEQVDFAEWATTSAQLTNEIMHIIDRYTNSKLRVMIENKVSK